MVAVQSQSSLALWGLLEEVVFRPLRIDYYYPGKGTRRVEPQGGAACVWSW
jgi:hypothetical protein